MIEGRPDIIIIRGAPCSGKSTTAKILSEFFPTGVRVEVDTLRNMIISVDWKNQSEHINLLHLSTKLVCDFLDLGFSPVILVDTFSGDKLTKFLADLHELKSDATVRIFGLYTSEDEMKKRTDGRGEGEFRDFKICRRLNEEVCKAKYENEYQIDTTGLTSAQTSAIIYKQITN